MQLEIHPLKRAVDAPPTAAVKLFEPEQVEAAVDAGIEVICADFSKATHDWPTRAPKTHFQFTIGYGCHKSLDDLISDVENAMVDGASSVYCVTHVRNIEVLAARGIPVFGHCGLVPQICTGTGGLQAVGKTASQANRILEAVQQLRSAGAIGVHIHVVPRELAAQISTDSGLVTMSVGAGGECDVVWLHAEDILDRNSNHAPRHAKTYRNVHDETDQACFHAFRQDVVNRSFPTASNEVSVGPAYRLEGGCALDAVQSG